MELIGLLVKTSHSIKYTLTIAEYFLKWAKAPALPNKTAVGVAKFLYSTGSGIASWICAQLHLIIPI